MDIYITSRGVSAKDYDWLKINNQDKSTKEQTSPIPDYTDLINANAESLSLVLSRSKGKLLLLITGLKTSERKDNQGRPIRNSVAWIAENSDDSVIRALIVQALRDELAVTIDKVIKNSASGGFDIVWSECAKLTPPGITGQSLPNKQQKFGNLEHRKKELVDEINNLSNLPHNDGLLVVITSICDKKNFKDKNVWRGLSSQINLNDEEWNKVDKSTIPNGNNVIRFLRNFSELLNRTPVVVFIAVIAFSLAMNFLLLKPFVSTKKNQQTN